MSQALMEAASEVARLAGSLALAHFRKGVSVELKADLTPVTAADREAEAAARTWIEAHFPDHGVLGEEFGESRAGAKVRWIVDPIDGTKTFVRGVPLWGTLVAVCEGEKVLAGAAFFPAVDELLVAAPGQGTFHNGRRCHVSDQAELSQATVLTTDPRFPGLPQRGQRFDALEQRALISRSWGDCYGYLLVATGRAEAMIDPVMSPWDAAAIQPLIEEAGGVFTDWKGQPTAFGGDVIATNAALATVVREVLMPERTR